ncbi:MAG: radical SAM protein [Oligoflexia bacterium]|nr:radical SAM protein [Oligoflexia bacterium]
MNHRDWYQRNAPELQQEGLWLRGGELNTLPLSEYDSRPFRALFARLSTYLDTGYSFTHQLLYQLAAGTPGVFPDLAYLPPRGDAAIFDRDGVPWLLGTQTKRGPEGFDLIGFSNSIVQELINLRIMLARSGIPLSKAERLERPEVPLLLLGGANALYSSAAWLDAPLVDAIFVGESDQAIREILELCRDGKAAGRPKSELLSELARLPGVFEPDRPGPTRKSFVWDLNRSMALERAPIPYVPEQAGAAHLQISEGCPCFCSFCAESWERRPYRERSSEVLREKALRLKASMGLDTVDLYSFNFNLHSELYGILWELAPNFRHIGLKSQRFDLLAHDPEMLRFQQVLDKTSLTCGLEGISPRMRRYLHKNLDDGELHRSLEAIFKVKARELKVFMIATGLEEEQDFEELGGLLEHLNQARRRTDARTRVIFSMTPLVRFPWTPLEFEDAFPMARFEPILRKTAGRVRAAGFEFREAADLPEYWVSQVLVRAAEPAVARALGRAIERTDFVYYREIPEGFRATLESALREEGLEPERLLLGFSLEESRAKPWATIETGVKREFLWERAQLARRFGEIDYCLGRSWTKARCSHCGGCPTRHHVRAIVLADQKRGYSVDDFKARRLAAQRLERKLGFLVEVGAPARGLPRKMMGVALARALMLSASELVPLFRGFAGAHWSKEDEPVWVTGKDALTLVWSEPALALLASRLADPAWLARVNAELGEWGKLLGAVPPSGWAPSGLRLVTSWEPRLEAYLKARGLKHTLRKDGDGGYVFELTPESVRRGFLRKLSRKKLEDGAFGCELATGPKFELTEFLAQGVLGGKGARASRIRLEAF